MTFDLRQVPFSRRGSWLAFSFLSERFLVDRFSDARLTEGLYFRTVREGGFHREIFRLEVLLRGVPVPFEAEGSPACFRLRTASGALVEIGLPDPAVVRFRGRGAGLRLTATPSRGQEYPIPYDDTRWLVNCMGADLWFAVTPLSGRLRVDAPWAGDQAERLVLDFLPDDTAGADGEFEAAMEASRHDGVFREFPDSFEDGLARVQREFDPFLDGMPDAPGRLAPWRELAAYLDWSCVVDPEGQIRRPSILMSKNWMTSVWSWDHCFNAVALSFRQPALAWDQLMTLFDHQDDQGALPDSISNAKAVWSFRKPPIHGWALLRMIRNGAVDRAKMEEIYSPLGRWTDWWFRYRDFDCDGIPQYLHGNDSGWDNSTVFRAGPAVESPDLPVFLVLQMDALATVAAALGRGTEAEAWTRRSEDLVARFLAHSRRGDRLAALLPGTHEEVPNRSLLSLMPLLLGPRLPGAVRRALLATLERERFLSEWGLATESPDSPAYEADGYWRGPIWAPATLLMVDGLRASGEAGLARTVAERFARMVERSGFAENYNALAGEGLRDRAYTWSASVFLTLAHEYLCDPA